MHTRAHARTSKQAAAATTTTTTTTTIFIHGPPRFLPTKSSSLRGLPPPLRGRNSSSKESPVLPIPSYPALYREDTTSWNHGRPGTHHKPERITTCIHLLHGSIPSHALVTSREKQTGRQANKQTGRQETDRRRTALNGRADGRTTLNGRTVEPRGMLISFGRFGRS